MLDQVTKDRLRLALDGLRRGDAGGWAAIAPLTQLSAAGCEVSIDFAAEAEIGAPVIVARQVRRPAVSGLTSRQVQVLGLVARGLSNKAIARDLGISPATVKDHVHALLQVLGLRSRAEVIARMHAG